jgi:hypothetical protein
VFVTVTVTVLSQPSAATSAAVQFCELLLASSLSVTVTRQCHHQYHYHYHHHCQRDVHGTYNLDHTHLILATLHKHHRIL